MVVTEENRKPEADHLIDLWTEGVRNSGGHRHKGEIPAGQFSKDTGSTNSAGVFISTYTSSIFGGEYLIIARSGNIQGFEKVATITVKVPELNLLPITFGSGSLTIGSDSYLQVGGKPEHPGPSTGTDQLTTNTNHFGTLNLISAIQGVAKSFNNKFSPQAPDQLLAINDMSLSQGGKFDVGGNWNSSPDHEKHRVGLNVDIRYKNLIKDRRDWLLFEKDGFENFFEKFEVHSSNTTNIHFHCTASPSLDF